MAIICSASNESVDSLSFSPAPASKLLRSHVGGSKVLLVTNDRISPMYLERYEALLKEGGDKEVETLVLPDGEENKNMEVLGMILDKALECAFDRKATFVALGGGVIGDMVGFAAAIYQRGVNFIQVSSASMTIFVEVMMCVGTIVCSSTNPSIEKLAKRRFQRQSWQWSIHL